MTGNDAAAIAQTPHRHALDQAVFGLLLLVLLSGNFSIAVSQIALGLTLLTGLASWGLRRRGPASTGLERVTLLLVGWAALMIPFSADPAQSLLFSKRFFLYAVLWLAADRINSEDRRRWAMAALLTGAGGISLVSALQVMHRTGSLFATRLDHVSNAMTSGALLMLVALVALGVLLCRGTSWSARAWVGLALAPILLALVMTMTRSAVLGLGAGVAAMLVAARPRWFLAFAGAGVALVVLLLLFGEQFLSARMWSRIDPEFIVSGVNTVGRLEMWQVGWRMVAANPWLGVGDIDLQAVAPAYYGGLSPAAFGHLHSNLVHLAVIWGVPGLVFALAFLGRQLWLLARRWRSRERHPDAAWQQAWVLGAIGMWVGFFVAGLTEWYFGDAEPMLIFLAVLGIALGKSRGRDQLPSGEKVG